MKVAAKRLLKLESNAHRDESSWRIQSTPASRAQAAAELVQWRHAMLARMRREGHADISVVANDPTATLDSMLPGIEDYTARRLGLIT